MYTSTASTPSTLIRYIGNDMNIPENFEVFIHTLQNGFYDMTELLLESHEDPSTLVNYVIPSSFECDDDEATIPDYLTAFEGLSPLTIAVETGDVELVKLLLSYGATLTHSRGCISALSIAIEMGTQDVFDLLLESNAPLDWRDPAYGWTLLVHAIVYNRPAMVTSLLERGVEYRIPTSTGISPLICAARLQMWSAVEQLLDRIPLLPANPTISPPSIQMRPPVSPSPDVFISVSASNSQEHEMLLQLLPCVHVSTVATVLSRRYQALTACPRRRHQIARYSFAASLTHTQPDTTHSCPYDAEGMGSRSACALVDIPNTYVDMSSSSMASSSYFSYAITNATVTATLATATTTCGCPPCKCPLPVLPLASAPPPTQPVPLLLDVIPNASSSAASALGSLRNVSLDPAVMDLGERGSRVMRAGYDYGLRRVSMQEVREREGDGADGEDGGRAGGGDGERGVDEERTRLEVEQSITMSALVSMRTLGPVPAAVSELAWMSMESNGGICARCANGWWDTEAVWGSQGCLEIGKKPVARGTSGENDFPEEGVCKETSIMSVPAPSSTKCSPTQKDTNPKLDSTFFYCRGGSMLHHILEHCAPRAPDADVAACLRMVLSYAQLVLVGQDRDL